MIYVGQKARTPEEGMEKVRKSITSKSALNKLGQMIKWQGGDERVVDFPSKFLTKSKFVVEIRAGSTGYIQRLDAKTVGISSVLLGAGRTRAEDCVDFGAGIILKKKTGDFVRQNELIASLYSSEHKKLMEAKQLFVTAFDISKNRISRKSIIKEILK
jgi:pyrimidine-nucleoside phosphorylase